MNKKLLTALLVFRGDWRAGMMAQSMEQKQKLPWKGYNAYTQPARENDIEIHIYFSCHYHVEFNPHRSTGLPCLRRLYGSKIGSGKTRALASMVAQLKKERVCCSFLNHFG